MTRDTPQTAAPLTIVSASRLAADAFRSGSLLGRSLLLPAHQDCATRITTGNREPLGAIYNQAIEHLDPHSLVVFCHDDLWLGERCLLPPLLEALEKFDLVGVAGSRRLIAGQPTWWLQPDGRTWDHPHLVGEIRHGDPDTSEPIRFGPSPASATMLDGVFLATRAGVLQRAGVRFDPSFPFHFYDLDFCHSARAAGLRLGVWPLPLIHGSPGAAGSPDWQRTLELYRCKWQPTLQTGPPPPRLQSPQPLPPALRFPPLP